MRNLIIITIAALIFFFVEFIIFNQLGPWLTPNLLLLLMIFFGLFLGIRFSLYIAVLAGIIRDSFSTDIFGIYLFSFVLCAFILSFIERNIYHRGSHSSRMVTVFFVSSIFVISQFVIRLMFYPLNPFFAFKNIYIPEVITTLLVTTFIFTLLKKCVSRYFV